MTSSVVVAAAAGTFVLLLTLFSTFTGMDAMRSIVISMSVGLFVCLSARISGKPHGRTSTRASFLLRQRCATLCTSGFVDDVTFPHSVLLFVTSISERRWNTISI